MLMKHVITILAMLLAPLACADAGAVKKALAEKMPDVKIRSVEKSPYAGLYEVVASGFTVFYTDEKAEIGIFNSMIELRTRTNLIESRSRELMKVDVSLLPLDKAIVQVKGNGARKLYVFSDPDCPYCRKLEGELQGINNVTIYTFLYPLTSIHPDALRKAELIWCSGNPAQSYSEMMLHGKEPQAGSPCKTPVQDIIELAQKLFINGTPGVVFGDGKLVPGALQRHQIEIYLDNPGRS